MAGRWGATLTIATVLRGLIAPALTVVWVFLVCFALLHAMPGDPLDRIDSPDVPGEQAERNRRALGLDAPVPLQLVRTLVSYAAGDLGVSTLRRRPVAAVLGEALPYTVLLGAAALAIAYGVGLPLSVFLVGLAPRVRRIFDQAIIVATTVPRFWFAVMLVLLFHGVAGWFPASHAISPGGGGLLDVLWHVVLPALSLGLPAALVVARYQFAALERGLADPHVRTARATGSGGARLLLKHVLRPSMGTTVALFGLDLPILVSGAVVIEVVFAWPGVGRLSADAVLSADYPLALGSTLLTASTVIVSRYAAERLAGILDPRILAEWED